MFIMNDTLIDLPVNSSTSFMWNFGSFLSLLLSVQLFTGLMLSWFFKPSSGQAFWSIYYIMDDVSFGWVMRFIHMNNVSLMNIFLIMHILRGLKYSSFKSSTSWGSGMLLLVILFLSSFLGYVLPWGQMSYWGATVITNMIIVVPVWGDFILNLLWGGHNVNDNTLNRFMSLHYVMPWLMLILLMLHIFFIHFNKSSNPVMMKSSLDKIFFYPYFLVKDFFFFVSLFFLFFSCVFFCDTLFLDLENYKVANPMVTPEHIQPEWYFLFFYAILRAVPNKLGGIILMVLSMFMIYSMALTKFKPNVFNIMVCYLCLLWSGAQLVDSPFVSCTKSFTVAYFKSFIFKRQ